MNQELVSRYQSSLTNLRRASRDLATHLDTAATDDFDTRSTVFVELWAHYKRALDDCQENYRQIPAHERGRVPRPPER